MRNPFKKGRGAPRAFDLERLAEQIPMAQDDVPEPMRGLNEFIEPLFEYCRQHNITFVGCAVENEEFVEALRDQTRSALKLPMMSGNPVIFAFLAAHLQKHAETVAMGFMEGEAAGPKGGR